VRGVNFGKIKDAATICQNFKNGFDAFIAFIAPYEETIKELGGSNTMQSMKKNLMRYEHTDDTQGMLDLLKGLRVTHQFSETNIELMVEAVILALACRTQFHYSLNHFRMAINAVRHISAKDLPKDIRGREIDQELDRRRYEALHEILVGY
jgi:hypothetical protein